MTDSIPPAFSGASSRDSAEDVREDEYYPEQDVDWPQKELRTERMEVAFLQQCVESKHCVLGKV